eukprot:1906357-Amphidinium_carterae.1
MFCVSNRQVARFALFLICDVGLFMSAIVMSVCSSQGLPSSRVNFRLRSAWYETCHHMTTFVVASCVGLAVSSNMVCLACTVISDHLRLHFVAKRLSVDLLPVVVMHLWMYQSATRFHCKHATQTWHGRRNALRVDHTSGGNDLPVGIVYTLWFLVCILASAPGVLYSVVKAVPGFLSVSGLWQWVISNVIALISGVVTGLGLDYFAGKVFAQAFDGSIMSMLRLAGLLLASILLPGLQLAPF